MEIRARRAATPGGMTQFLVAIALAVAMCAFGFAVYFAAGFLKAGHIAVLRPDTTTATTLPGTMYVVQGGVIYKFHAGAFTALTKQNGWMQPAISPDGSHILAVRRFQNYSDLYEISTADGSMKQLTTNSSKTVEANHWIFYPRFSADGSQVFYDFDPKDPYNSFRVDLAIYASPPNDLGRWVQWTSPNYYTGGDVTPIPLRNGDLLYTKFSIDANSVLHSQLWLQAGAGSTGVGLTEPALDCMQPAVSPDETRVAMVCRNGQTQSAELMVAAFDENGVTLAAPQPLVTGQLVTTPVFSPDGKTIAYLAPATQQGPFQLWTVRSSGSPSPRRITTNLGLDAVSAPVWIAK